MHSGNITPKEAIKLQESLRGKAQITPLIKEVKFIAGADVSMERFGDTLYAGIVVLSFPNLKVVDYALAKLPVTFPYIPGLLSFREIPALLEAWEKLKIKPDITIVDGHGIAHPRRLGIATHLGLLTKSPTIGCAKSLLMGTHKEPGKKRGSKKPIAEKGKTVGAAVRTKTNTKPVFVSPGHLTNLENAVSYVLNTTRGYKLPEPTRQAHLLVNMFRRGEIAS